MTSATDWSGGMSASCNVGPVQVVQKQISKSKISVEIYNDT